jgi:hypothetical protein
VPTLLKVDIVSAKDFIMTTADGQLDLKASKAMLGKIRSAAKGKEAFDILIDLRHTTLKMSTVDIWDLSAGLRELGVNLETKTAVLIAKEMSADKAEFLRLCATSRGFRINIFTDYEEAMKWLHSPVESKSEETI